MHNNVRKAESQEVRCATHPLACSEFTLIPPVLLLNALQPHFLMLSFCHLPPIRALLHVDHLPQGLKEMPSKTGMSTFIVWAYRMMVHVVSRKHLPTKLCTVVVKLIAMGHTRTSTDVSWQVVGRICICSNITPSGMRSMWRLARRIVLKKGVESYVRCHTLHMAVIAPA